MLMMLMGRPPATAPHSELKMSARLGVLTWVNAIMSVSV
jgi:hypothetical protein